MIRTVTAAFCLLGCTAGTAISSEKADEKVPEKTVYERIKERGWDFKFKDFTVSAFCGPNVTDVEYRLYKECGFNVVITPRRLHYHEEGETREDGYKKVDRALDLAQKHGLAVVLETYAHGHTAWGGVGGRTQGIIWTDDCGRCLWNTPRCRCRCSTSRPSTPAIRPRR